MRKTLSGLLGRNVGYAFFGTIDAVDLMAFAWKLVRRRHRHKVILRSFNKEFVKLEAQLDRKLSANVDDTSA